jgi:hypothetical protein
VKGRYEYALVGANSYAVTRAQALEMVTRPGNVLGVSSVRGRAARTRLFKLRGCAVLAVSRFRNGGPK